jgi:YidC/Oxa1 family membrane protein insertase
MELEDVIPFGRSIFGTINRWVIRPIFTFLSSFIGSMGIVILVLTFIVKMILYPLTYKMIHSQSKMGALKPHLANLREKFKDDPQKQQMETMKVYNEFGVNPLGGCLPTLLQMPIWFALYRFFPAAIEFRQVPFLWATDLSSYDVAFSLPFVIPFYGDHVSLFTLLWAATTVLYTYYNSQNMDLSMNPSMKYMQYLMPVMFLFFFNTFAAGLTCYLLFSNLINVGQTIVTKNYIIDQDKIMAGLEAYRKKPKKKQGFQDRLQEALKEQQRKQSEIDPKRKKK